MNPATGLRILHTESSTGWGGQEIRVFTELTWLRRRGHAVGVMVPPGSALGLRAERAEIPVDWIAMPRALDPLAVARIARRLRRVRAQVLAARLAWTFLRMFLLQRGWRGLVLSGLYAGYAFSKHAKPWELARTGRHG